MNEYVLERKGKIFRLAKSFNSSMRRNNNIKNVDDVALTTTEEISKRWK